MAEYRRPDVYIEEITSFPISVQEIESAVPVFIGCTEKDPGMPTQIFSMEDFKKSFGGPVSYSPDLQTLKFDETTNSIVPSVTSIKLDYFLYYALKHYFDNAGGKCFVLSNGPIPANGKFDPTAFKTKLEENIPKALDIEEVTLIVIPELTNLVTEKEVLDNSNPPVAIGKTLNYSDMESMVKKITGLINTKQKYEKFLIMDMADSSDKAVNNLSAFDESGFMGLATEDGGEFVAFYYPNIISTYKPEIADSKFEDFEITIDGEKKKLKDLKNGSDKLFINQLKEAAPNLILPPSAAMAGVYYTVDNKRNVWKAPANVGINGIKKLHQQITDEMHAHLNVNTLNQRSICAIRHIPGYGIKVLGARTLRGSSNDFRYINVRRTTSIFEKSIKNALKLFLFEPNNSDTWAFAKATIENYLYEKWEQGALYGAKQDQAFFVRVGLGVTMNGQDVLNGKMIVEIGLAIVRPAEFIILRFEQILPQA